jgi:endonuclease/exonuclease/phosphatase family metal-dependent hydrolase
MTYNIQELLSQSSYLISQLQALNADIMMLQLNTAGADNTAGKNGIAGRNNIVTLLKTCTKLGYSHYTRLDGQVIGGAGCIIVSKIPLAVSVSKKHAQKTASGPARFYVKVEIDLSTYNKKNLVLYGVYLDGQDATIRLAQAQELVASVKRYDQGKNVIIGGDFNEGHGAATNYLGSQGFIDSFDLAGVAKPTFTHWSRQVLDRLYVNRQSWNIWLDGAFVFYPGARHHTPVIMDIDPT